jgi:6,7-dimethyl-8-ribityllumazine synthase
MKTGPIQTGDISAGDARFAIVAARFNHEIVNNMLTAAEASLLEHGVTQADVDILYVPGAFELPLIASELANSGGYQAIITLGCVIRGDTPHFDFVCGESARGIMQVGLDTGVPVIFGVLTTDTLEQAQLRSQVGGENKGVDAALCALEMNNVLNQIRED